MKSRPKLGSLSDSVISLVGTDRETIILENDDGERANGMASFIEWTCPADATMFSFVDTSAQWHVSNRLLTRPMEVT